MIELITKSLAPKTLMFALFLVFASSASSLQPGSPDRSPDLDALPGFKSPPPGYGQVPFWWWSGYELDEERLLWQVRELHAKGISGVQVNYSHTDAPGWASDVMSSPIFSGQWWRIYTKVSAECDRLGIGIGLSTYTLANHYQTSPCRYRGDPDSGLCGPVTLLKRMREGKQE